MARKGKYTPVNPKKYAGNSDNIVYRSSWERRCMIWFDREPNVIMWGSEELIIPYYNPVKRRSARYFPDFVIRVRTASGAERTIMIEIKPDKQTRPPENSRKKSKYYIKECADYAVNHAKWKAAGEWCLDHGWNFKVVTEFDLGLS